MTQKLVCGLPEKMQEEEESKEKEIGMDNPAFEKKEK